MAIPQIHLAAVYSAMGEKEKAMESLRKNKSTNLLAVTQMKHNPMFDNIRDEADFQKILALTEKEYKKIHNEVAKTVRKYENQN